MFWTPRGIARKCQNPGGRIIRAADLVLECVNADSSIRKVLGIAKEYFKTNGGIEAAGVVVE